MADEFARPPEDRQYSTRSFVLLAAAWLLAAPWLLFPNLAPPLTAAGLLLLLAAWLVVGRGRFQPATDLDYYILVYLLLTGLAFLITPLPQVSLPKMLVVFLGVLGFYLAQRWLTTPDRLWHLVLILTLSGGGLALLALFTLEWPQRQIVDLQLVTSRLPHLSGDFFINFNEMAGTLVLLLPFAWAWWRSQPKRPPGHLRWQTVSAVMILCLMGLVLLLTQSRGAFISLLVAALAAFLWGRFSWRWLVLVVVAVALICSLAALLMNWTSAELFTWLDTLDASSKQGEVETSSWLSRLEIWGNAGQMLMDYPLLGAGLYTFEPISRANYVYELSPPDFKITHAHNLFLQTGASLGWGGLLLIVLLWLAVVSTLWSPGRTVDPVAAGLCRIFATSLVAYLTFNLFDTITLGQKPGILVWLVLAGSAALMRGQIQPAGVSWQRWVRLAPLFIVPIMALLALTPAGSRNWANLALDRARLGLASPAHLGPQQFAGDARRLGLLAHLQGQPAAALTYWSADPQAAVYLANQGRNALEAGRLAEAVSWYELALALDPTSSLAFYWLGEAYQARGLADQALLNYEQAAYHAPQENLDPGWQAHIFFSWGQALAGSGQWAAAVVAYQTAVTLNSEVALYYQALGDALTVLGDKAGAANAFARSKSGP